jgi:hypothetical protein
MSEVQLNEKIPLMDKLKKKPVPQKKKLFSVKLAIDPENVEDTRRISNKEDKFKVNREEIVKSLKKKSTMGVHKKAPVVEVEEKKTKRKLTFKIKKNSSSGSSSTQKKSKNSDSDFSDSSDSDDDPKPIPEIKPQDSSSSDSDEVKPKKSRKQPEKPKKSRKQPEKPKKSRKQPQDSSSSDSDEEKPKQPQDSSDSDSDDEKPAVPLKSQKISLKNVKPKKETFTIRKTTVKSHKKTSPKEKTVVKENPAPPPPQQVMNIRTSTYYLNNRKKFIEFIHELFESYIKQNKGVTEQEKNELLTHQQIAKEYLNAYSPYRGLLLFYGLGTGKSATAVSIAEGVRENKRIFLLIPASLETNFVTEIKKFGDPIFNTSKQHWVWVSVEGDPELIPQIANIMSLPANSIKKKGGAWMMNLKKKENPNFDKLTSSQQTQIDEQIREMIKIKYQQINYNANNLKKKIKELSADWTINPFNNSVVIIDEAHKFVSLIVGKINKNVKDIAEHVSLQLYTMLMQAQNARVVLLSGTPIVNYPNEIAVMFNMLRGAITTWNFRIKGHGGHPTEHFQKILKKHKFMVYDYIAVHDNILTVTRNPFGFVNRFTKADAYQGVEYDQAGNITDVQFEEQITSILKNEGIQIQGMDLEQFKALPDTTDSFLETFLEIQNIEKPVFKENKEIVFMKRILGLTSYYRVENNDPNLPSLVDEDGDLFHTQNCAMSTFQFGEYKEIRKKEVEEQKQAIKNGKKNKDDLYKEVTSSYRTASRACCNFAFPVPPGRPRKEGAGKQITEDEWDGETPVVDDQPEPTLPDQKYKQDILNALAYLKNNQTALFSKKGLAQYSPKFLQMLENVTDPDNVGLHLVYSHFRTMEGVGIFQMVLEAHGYVQFKIKKSAKKEWEIVGHAGKSQHCYALYTGTEDAEEREIIRKTFNGDWEGLPASLVSQLTDISSDNLYGEVVKVLLITSSAAEGINLRNTRFVHLMEPYWHMVRLQQVIGRARRFKSHEQLPAKYRNVKVFLYLTTFSKEQTYKINHTIGEGELKASDVSRRDPTRLMTTDETLFELSDIKLAISNLLLKSVKSSSVDCQLHHKPHDSHICYHFGKVKSDNFASYPTIEKDEAESHFSEMKVEKIGIQLKIKDKLYYADKNEKMDEDSTTFQLFSDSDLTKKVGYYDKDAKKVVLST